MKKVFTIIKENSQRVPQKNFRELGGKPLWRWLVDELSDFELYINTDSVTLIQELKSYSHVKIIKRSIEHIEWELEAEHRGSPVMSMVQQFCQEYLSDEENFALVHITSPFLKEKTLKTAFQEYENNNSYSLHSVKKIQDALMFNRNGLIEPSNFVFDRVSRTQDLEPIYQSLGAFFIMNKEKLEMNNYRRLSEASIVFPLSPLEAIEIDNEDDFSLSQLVAESLKGDNL